MENNIITLYKSKIDNIRIQLPYLNSKKRELTIPEIFEKENNENFISTYLAYILNPTKNGIGRYPLESIINYFIPEFDTSILNWGEVEIYREVQLDENSRIDITILFPGELFIGIENKIRSTEHFQQTIRYSDKIATIHKKCTILCILLNQTGDNPQSPNFKTLTYKQLYNLLSDIKIDFMKNLKKGVIFHDFLTYIKEVLLTMNDKFELSKKTELYIKSLDLFKDLRESFKEEEQKIIYLTRDMSENIFGNNFSYDWRKNYQQIYKQSWIQNKLFVHYEFWITGDSLFDSKKIQFMIDVEGNLKNIFFDNFEKFYPKYANFIAQKSIVYRPKHRKVALAFKEYEVFKNINSQNDIDIQEELNNLIQLVHDDFIFFSSLIDKCIPASK